MLNFEFQNPVHVLFGKGEIAKLSHLLKNKKKVMITFGGGSIKKNGVYQQVVNALEGISFVEFGGIEPNPRYETLMEAVALAKKEGVDFLLAVGGGSVIDGTKFISQAICYEGSDPFDVYRKRLPISKAIDLGSVLTLSATGSEMNMFTVVTKGKDKLGYGHPLLYPKFSIIDPTVMFSLPKKQVANGIVDAFVHVTEQYLTYSVNTPLQDRIAEGILLTLLEEGPKVMSNLEDYDARANMVWCCTMALNGIIGVGVVHDWATHGIGHELTALQGIDHGRTLAVVLPSLLRVQKDKKKEKLIQFANRVFGINESDENKAIELGIKAMEEFFHSLEVPTTLGDYGLDRSFIEEVKENLRSRQFGALGEHQDIDLEKVGLILEGAL